MTSSMVLIFNTVCPSQTPLGIYEDAVWLVFICHSNTQIVLGITYKQKAISRGQFEALQNKGAIITQISRGNNALPL